MSDSAPCATLDEGGVRLAVRVTPGADRERIEGMEADAAGRHWLRVRLAAPPVDGKANQALLKFLAKRWRMPKSALVVRWKRMVPIHLLNRTTNILKKWADSRSACGRKRFDQTTGNRERCNRPQQDPDDPRRPRRDPGRN